MNKSLWIAFLFTISTFTYAQEDTLKHTIRTNLSGSINRVSDGQTFLLKNSLGYSFSHKRIVLNTRAEMVFGESLESVTNRDYQLGADFNVYFNDAQKWYAWGLLNELTSYSLKINNQFQGGVGIAWKAIKTDNFYLNISDGIIYEHSDITTSEGDELIYSTFRNSLRVNFRYNSKEDKIVFRSSNFWQPSLQYSGDYIISSNTELNFKLYKWLHLNTTLQYNQVSRTGKENLLFTYGILVSHKF